MLYLSDHDILRFCDEVQVFPGIFQQIAPELVCVSVIFSKDVFNKKNTLLN
jgi:hypothetical protein